MRTTKTLTVKYAYFAYSKCICRNYASLEQTVPVCGKVKKDGNSKVSSGTHPKLFFQLKAFQWYVYWKGMTYFQYPLKAEPLSMIKGCCMVSQEPKHYTFGPTYRICTTESSHTPHLTFAWGNQVLFLVQVIPVALNMASSALQGRRWLKDMPQRFGTGLTVGREVVECRNEFMAFVILEVSFFTLLNRFHFYIFPTFTFICIQYLHLGMGEKD